MPDIESKWRCEDCGLLHEWEDDAVDCCPVEVSEVFICPLCSDDYASKIEAKECCEHEEDTEQTPTQAELEAAGQSRMFGA